MAQHSDFGAARASTDFIKVTPTVFSRERAEAKGGRDERRVDFDEEARFRGEGVYSELSEARPGMLGAVTARAEAQVVRLALIYALLDGADAIGLLHLDAALAVWSYADASAAHIFRNSLGDNIADIILDGLRKAGSKGMTRSEIGNLFSRHQSSERIASALNLLSGEDLATMEPKKTGGRSSEIWRVR